MSYTTNLMSIFSVERHQVKQEGSKQCAVLHLTSKKIFVSYTTVVGLSVNGVWYFTGEKYSVTTTQQVGAFSASRIYLPSDVFDEALTGDAAAIISLYQDREVILSKQRADFSEYYRIGMLEDRVSLHCVALVNQLNDKLLVNRLTREVKALLISQIVDYEAGSEDTNKRYNKFKAKFNKAISI